MLKCVELQQVRPVGTTPVAPPQPAPQANACSAVNLGCQWLTDKQLLFDPCEDSSHLDLSSSSAAEVAQSDTMSFSFGFGGDDIEGDEQLLASLPQNVAPSRASASAFPVAGKPLLPAVHHDLSQMLAALPSKLVYGLLDVDLDGTGNIQLPRRELWDVRVQLMAEDDSEAALESGLGTHDVKTGVYEGGFKSWESSVDLVKTLASSKSLVATAEHAIRVIEVSCVYRLLV